MATVLVGDSRRAAVYAAERMYQYRGGRKGAGCSEFWPASIAGDECSGSLPAARAQVSCLGSLPSQLESSLGYPSGYTSVAVKEPLGPSGKLTRVPALQHYGSVHAVSAALSSLAVARGWRLLLPEAVLDAGACRASWNDAPAYVVDKPVREDDAVRGVTARFLARAERGGSDVRLDVGVPFRAKAWPRCSLDPQVWTWREVVSTVWQNDA